MTTAVTTKRICTTTNRRVRWDRVFTCALTPVLAIGLVQGISSAYTDGLGNAKSTSSVIEDSGYLGGYNANYPITTEVTNYTETTEVQTTTAKRQILVDESQYGFKLEIKASDKSMGIEGIYFSKKLGRLVSVRELKMLAMLVLSESALEPHDTQVGVAATVLNRVLDEKMFPNSIEEVVTQPAQFSPVIMKNPENSCSQGYNGFYLQGGKVEVFWEDYSETVQNSVRQAVYEALDGTDPTECVNGALYYCNMNVLTYEELKYRENIGENITLGSTTFYRDWN